jgi:SAM-dependent methyltransferase
MSRLPTSTPALNAEETAWWREFGDLEERYCWVQPASVRRLLRRRYVREIAALVRPGERVLEVGCGTGWLTSLLAEAGVHALGIDFSSTQIDRARRTAHATGQDLEFRVTDLGSLRKDGQRFDVVITHAVLHHLATDELQDLLDDAVDLLAPGGRFVAVEPVTHPEGRIDRHPAERLLFWLERLPSLLARRRLRRVGPTEASLRQRVEGRGRARPPLGPSPKETAFVGDELVELVQRRMVLTRREPVASMRFRVAEQVLLAEASQPRLWRAVRWPLLALTERLDGRLVRARQPLRDVWVFEMYVGLVAA